MIKKYLLKSFMSAGGVFIYVSALAWFFFNGAEKIFGQTNSFVIPIFMLLLFIISASITGLLVIGNPVLLYLNNLKKEAFILLFETLGWLIFFLLLIVVALLQ